MFQLQVRERVLLGGKLEVMGDDEAKHDVAVQSNLVKLTLEAMDQTNCRLEATLESLLTHWKTMRANVTTFAAFSKAVGIAEKERVRGGFGPWLEEIVIGCLRLREQRPRFLAPGVDSVEFYEMLRTGRLM